MEKQILIISKSPSPPWNDSAKNIIKAILEQVEGFRMEYFSDGNNQFKGHIEKKIYQKDTSYALSLSQQISIFLNLLKPDYRNQIYHYFFSPNIKSSLASHLVQFFKYQPSIQTVLSLPRSFEHPELLFFGKEIVTMSDTAKHRLNKLGFENVTRIYPGVDAETINKDEMAHQKNKFGLDNDVLSILYAGDYNDSLDEYIAFIKEEMLTGKPYKFIFAIREKSVADRERLDQLKRKISRLDIPMSYLKLYGEMEEFKNLLKACDVLLMTQTDLYAKMDIPLVVLEAMVYKKAVILFDNPFFHEINKEENIFMARHFQDVRSALDQLLKLSTRTEMGVKNRHVIKKYFSNARMVGEYEKLYNKLL